MSKTFIFVFMICSFCVNVAAQGTQAPQIMVPGQPVERLIAGGESHTFQINLSVGQFMRVVVEQKGINVAVALVAPDGKQLIESDLTETLSTRVPLSYEAAAGTYQLVIRANGPETRSGTFQEQMELNVIAEAKIIGDYRLRSTGAAAARGAYQVRLELKDVATSQDRKRMAAEQLLIEAAAMTRRMDFQQSIEKRQQALLLWRELGERDWEGDTLHSVGSNYESLSRYDKAAEYYEQALTINHERKDREGEARSLSDLGLVEDRLSHYDRSLEYFAQALAINQELRNRREEGVTLGWMGWLNYRLKRLEKAIELSGRALLIAREVKNRDDEGGAIKNLALAYRELGQYEKAVEYGEQYLAIKRESKSRVGEASALQILQICYRNLFRFEKGIECLERALQIYRELKARQREAHVLRNLGDTYAQITRLDKTVESYEQALPIYRELKDHLGEVFVIIPLAYTYANLGRTEKAIEYLEQALAISREFNNRAREAQILLGLGDANQSLGRYEKALKLYEQSLASLSRDRKQASGGPFEATVTGSIGETYLLMGGNDKAVEFLQQALMIFNEAKWRMNETVTYYLLVLGDAYRAQGQYPQATQRHEQTLRFAREIKSPDEEASALNSLMLDWKARSQPSLAIFFGKQAVNVYQEIRSNIRSLDIQSQQSFLKSKEKTYRTLADLLISEGRLPEAEQVIRMLKDEEYFEYIRRDSADAPQGQKAQLTQEEAAIEKRYREIADQLAALGTERGTLMEKKSRTPDEEQRLAKLDADLVLAGNAFQKFLSQLEAELGPSSEASAKAFALRESQGLMEDLRELDKGVVALYTLLGEDKYRVILTTADFQKGYEYPIKAADLNRKVLEFREALQNPRLDPLPPAQELYKILLGPVAKDLAKAKNRTIMWSLDGVLRYVPVSALNDGKQYLVEQYQNVVFTPASQARLKDVPARNWDALGLGVTKAHGERIPALPGVLDEMHGIIRESVINAGAKSNQPGVLPGVVKLDEQFTQEVMLAQLRQRPKVVHIASHFQFSPGNETNSALLLGDGTFLSLAQIKSLPNVFGGVELLTLSACNTATGGSGANGKEVEGFGVLAQRQGAKAVVASLWPVADRSTKQLMQEFYRSRESQMGMSKIEALREAQLKLLRGEITVDTTQSASRQISHDDPKPGEVKRPLFKLDPKAPFAHPYYWAPFILIGNWK
jgi:CHAT domain-containing protein